MRDPGVANTVPSTAHYTVVKSVARKATRMVTRFAEISRLVCPVPRPFQSFEPHHKPKCVDLVSDLVDLPTTAATCDPCRMLQASDGPDLGSVTTFFEDINFPAAFEFKGSANKKLNYAHLVGRQLKCGKLRLRLATKGCAEVFGVEKPGRQEIREIWNGHELSMAANKPPPPPHLANRAIFLELFKKTHF